MLGGRGAAALVALAVVACSEATPPAPGLPPEPVRPELAAPLMPLIDAMSPGATTFGAPLPTGDTVVVQGDEILLVHPPPDPAVTLGSTADTGALRAATVVDGATLLVGESGLFVLEPEGILPSPLAGAIAETEIVAIAGSAPGAGAAELWLLTPSKLWLWREGTVQEIAIEGVSLDGARIAYGATLSGSRALWVAVGDDLYALTTDSTQVSAWSVRRDGAVTSLAVDGTSSLWIVMNGDLQVRAPDGRWAWYRLPVPAATIVASPDAADVWIETTDGALWHSAGGAFRAVEGVPPHDARSAGPGGALWVYGASGIDRLRPRHDVTLHGIAEDGVVSTAVEVPIEPELAAHVTTIAAAIDGAPLAVLDAPSRVVLTPDGLNAGRHELVVDVAYDDGTLPAATHLHFIAVTEPLTWTGDIQPIFTERCAACHGPAGPSPTRLDSSDAWRWNIDLILDNVRAGRMPLVGGPLDPVTIGKIEAWAATGFAE